MTAAKPKQAKALVVQSVTEQGRWRAGRKFTRTPVTFDDLDEVQAAAIKADPMLIVREPADQSLEDNAANTKAVDDQAAAGNAAADDQTAGDNATTDAKATDTKPAPKAKAAKPKAGV